MIRRLIIINLVLLVLIGLLGWQLRRKILLAGRHEQSILAMKTPAAEVAQPAPLGKIVPIDATAYQDAVAKNLFSQDRNPNPIPDPPPPPPAAPPVPAFPVARGVMIWGNLPPTVVLSLKGSREQRGYHPGEKVGDWKILSVDNQFIVLEWNGQQFKRRLDELMDHTPLQMAEAAPAPAAPAAAAAQPASKSLSDAKDGQGPDMGGGIKACVPGDKQPAGAVMNGLKKIVSQTPFGSVCRWEPAQ